MSVDVLHLCHNWTCVHVLSCFFSGTYMIYLGLRVKVDMFDIPNKQTRKMKAIFRKRWRVHLFLMDIAWYSWVLSYLFLKISVSSSYFLNPWKSQFHHPTFHETTLNKFKQHIESKFQTFDWSEGPIPCIRSMNPAPRTCGWHCDHGDVSFRDSALWCRFLLWSKLGRNMWRKLWRSEIWKSQVLYVGLDMLLNHI